MNNSMMSLLPEMADVWQQTLNWQPSIQQQAQLQRLYELILEGNQKLNLTRITDPQEFWEKHLWDSLRGVAPLLRDGVMGGLGDRENTQLYSSQLPTSLSPHHEEFSPTFIDIGTGAGFPGIPVAIALPNCTITLLDSTRKKIAFIEKILPELELTNVKLLTGRVEEIGQQPQHRQNYDVVTIRAVSTASVCAEYALPLLKQDGLAIIYRGNWTGDENKALENAVKQLGGVIESIEKFATPLSNSIRHCLYLRKVAATPAKFPRAVGIPTQKPL